MTIENAKRLNYLVVECNTLSDVSVKERIIAGDVQGTLKELLKLQEELTRILRAATDTWG